MPPPTIVRVFISYSHDSPQHRQRVLALANQLRADGVEAWIDQYIQDPEEGWISWMRNEVKQADRVLLVFTETYLRRFEGNEVEGKGLGATFEGVIVTQWLYESGGRNAKFRPVVFRAEDEQFIPVELRRFNRYRVDTPENYQALLRWLRAKPPIVAPPVGQGPDLPPEAAPELFPSKPGEPKKVVEAVKDTSVEQHPTREDLAAAQAEYIRLAQSPGWPRFVDSLIKQQDAVFKEIESRASSRPSAGCEGNPAYPSEPS